MQIQIEVVQADEVKGKKNSRGGVYSAVELVYKKDGKVEAKPFPDWANAEIYQTLVSLKKGDVRTVTMEKDTNGYWKWLALTEGDSAAVATEASSGSEQPPRAANGGGVRPSTGKVIGSNYETSEERARRQVMIVRQSSISSAIAMLTARNLPAEVDANNVIDVAKRFEHFVLGE